ncbi:hypothetical protein [Poseidonibacter ostreae]|uniref:Uncharacterized protein n=1 Tax=Poseidonibacter ostreae TaxID=2654171 RepID=A0A6L4WWT5_9BACT|nr:hypothetical protein [Poseidonibacter ostreae]KAB7891319.1 hypothetical protein GBG19_00350 [Poseidonibacter ostreae]
MQESAIFTIALSMMFLFFMTLITLYIARRGVKYFSQRAKEKKSIKILSLGYEIATVDSNGVPLLFKKDNTFVSINDKGVLNDKI